jgi:hypothetical protein
VKNDDATPTKAMSVKAKFVVAFAAVLALCVWWLLSDREPTQKEMTFAYRTYLVAINSDRNSEALVDLRRHLHEIELVKQRCYKLASKRYRCEATVMMNDQPVESRRVAGNAIYSRNSKGWQFETIGEE